MLTCERCGERPALVRYTELRDGETRKLRLCHECAEELGFRADPDLTADPPAPPSGLFLSAVAPGTQQGVVTESTEYDSVRCAGCGVTGSQLRDQVVLGCPRCYTTFARALDDVILRMHGALAHRGRLPGGRTSRPEDVEQLRDLLRAAIEREDYDEAARIRNRLRRPEKGGA